MVGLKKERVYKKLRDDIKNGVLPAGSQLPREVDLSQSLGISRVTLRPALQRLENEGYIKRLHGSGTFVAPESEHGKTQQTLIVISKQDNRIYQPQNYIVPEIFRFAAVKNLRVEHFDIRYVAMSTPEEFVNLTTELNTIGIILISSDYLGNEPSIEILKATHCPVILPHGKEFDHIVTGFTTFYTSRKASWQTGLEYLSKNGYKRVAQLGSGSLTNGKPFRDHTLFQTMELSGKLGLDTNPDMFATADIEDIDSIEHVLTSWLNLKQRPEAILCFSDFFAFHIIKELKKQGISIPDKMAIMGICGAPDAAFLNPPLTSVDYCYSDLAKQAVELIADGNVPESGTRIEHQFVLRERASVMKRFKKNKTPENSIIQTKTIAMEVSL